MNDLNVMTCVEDLEQEVGLSGVPVYGNAIVKGAVKVGIALISHIF